ncbi:MAG: hypothetical protein DRP35_10125, partial [Candidatus Zixiibacteriota bacterium]
MKQLDVLVIGGHSLFEVGGAETKDEMRLTYSNHQVTLDFIENLIDSRGDLDKAEKLYQRSDKTKLFSRSLNVIYLYDFLTKHNFSVEAVNYFLYEQDKFNQLIKLKPKVVAISTTFICDANQVVEIAKAVRKLSPESIIVAGGAKVLKSYREYQLSQDNYFEGFDVSFLNSNSFFFNNEIDKYVDAFVIEEAGESTLLEIINNIKNKQPYRHLSNIAYRKNGDLVVNKFAKEPNLSLSNIIDWEKIPESIVGQEIPIQAGIGCPFKCEFCDFAGLNIKVKLRNIDNIIAEIKNIKKRFPDRPIYFTDENLFVNSKRTKEICRAIIESKLNIKWRSFFRADAVNEDNVALIAESGCQEALIGVESLDDDILKNMQKRVRSEEIQKCIYLLNQHNIKTLCTFIIGFPGETNLTINNTINSFNSIILNNRNINRIMPFLFMPCLLSPVMKPDRRKLYKLEGSVINWSHSSMNYIEADKLLKETVKRIDNFSLVYIENT